VVVVVEVTDVLMDDEEEDDLHSHDSPVGIDRMVVVEVTDVSMDEEEEEDELENRDSRVGEDRTMPLFRFRFIIDHSFLSNEIKPVQFFPKSWKNRKSETS
jgi:hypothetical protein